jgi:hypothetical protein
VCDDKGVHEDLGGIGCQMTFYLAQPIAIEVGDPRDGRNLSIHFQIRAKLNAQNPG